MPCFPQSSYTHTKNFKQKLCPACHAARRRHRAETAPHTASHITSFRNPVQSDWLWKHRGSHTSLLSNLHIVPRLPRKVRSVTWATSWLSYSIASPPALHCEKHSRLASPNVTTHTKISKQSYAQRATQPGAFATPRSQIYCENTGIRTLPYFQTCTLSHACHANCHLFTNLFNCELFNGELPLNYSIDWAFNSELPLAYFTEQFNCELRLEQALDWAIQLWATSWLLYHLTELSNCS